VVHVELDFEAGVDPIAGYLDDERGSKRRFVGWLGLMSILERTLARPLGGDVGPTSATRSRPERRP
jgi:hypothetical protein